MTARLERALLSLEGLSLGDAFGETFFTDRATEMIRTRSLRDGHWRWTDDTAMAASVVDTLIARETVDQNDLARRFAVRYIEDPVRGYGPGMHHVLAEIHHGRHWRVVSTEQFSGQGSYGNGAAMRASPVGAWFADDLGSVITQARMSAEVTHANAEGIAGAIAVAVAAALASRGASCPTGRDFIAAVLEHLPDGQVCDRVRRALTISPQLPIGYVVAALGNGSRISAQDTVPLVLWCASQHLTDYEQAQWLTVSALGDRDTTCAMVGGIVACRVGYGGLPSWLSRREPLPLGAGAASNSRT